MEIMASASTRNFLTLGPGNIFKRVFHKRDRAIILKYTRICLYYIIYMYSIADIPTIKIKFEQRTL